MQRFGVRDVERLLGLSRSTLRSLIEAGFVSPERGPRNTLRFSFQDLIVLRTAEALAKANIPRRRITRSVRELRKNLPQSMPLSGLAISAVGDRVVVREGSNRWQADDGQYLLAFEGDPAKESLEVIEPAAKQAPHASALDWFERGLALEGEDEGAALEAYAHALEADPELLDAHLNRGRLLHEAGRLAEAERAYTEALSACGAEPLLLFNFGVLLEDLGQKEAAVEAYCAALEVDPALADAHYNLALLYESLQKPKEAIRHMAQYRRLARAGKA
jgi:tetratricopeptide (TPR) repeat protein